jgi:hypothetical protein
MDEQLYSLPNLVLSFQMTIKSRRDVLLEALDRVMSLVQTLPCAEGDLADLRLAIAESRHVAKHHLCGVRWSTEPVSGGPGLRRLIHRITQLSAT